MLLTVGDIVLDRAVRPPGVMEPPELIVLSDGSLVAYACALYIRWRKIEKNMDGSDNYHVRLVCGMTAPRSEVSGFLIATRLLKVVINVMDVKPSQVTIATGGFKDRIQNVLSFGLKKKWF